MLQNRLPNQPSRSVRRFVSAALGAALLGAVGILPFANSPGGPSIAGAQTLSDPVKIGKALERVDLGARLAFS